MSDETSAGDPLPAGIGPYVLREVLYRTADEDAGPFDSLEEYLESGCTWRAAQMRAYPLAGYPHTAICLPQGEPSYPQLPLAAILRAVNDLPDVRLMRSVVVIDGAHPLDPWARRQLGADARYLAAAELDARCQVALYRPVDEDTTRTTLIHEWWHFQKWQHPIESGEFDAIGDAEPFILIPPPPAVDMPSGRSEHERWAMLGEVMLAENPAAGWLFARLNPRRSAILAAVLERVLYAVPPELRGPRHFDYLDVAVELKERRA